MTWVLIGPRGAARPLALDLDVVHQQPYGVLLTQQERLAITDAMPAGFKIQSISSDSQVLPMRAYNLRLSRSPSPARTRAMTYRLEPSLVELFDLRNEDGGFNESEYGDPHIWINADVFRRTGVVFQGQPGRLLAVDLSDGEGRRAASEFPGLLVALDTYLLANDLVS